MHRFDSYLSFKSRVFINRSCFVTGTNGVDFNVFQELDLEFVLLGGNKGLQSNKCAECSRTLDPSSGHCCNEDLTNGVTTNSGKPEVKKKHIHWSMRKVMQKKTGKEISPGKAKRISVCYATGLYFCERCHWNDQWYIPGSIFILNDSKKYPVSIVHREFVIDFCRSGIAVDCNENYFFRSSLLIKTIEHM